MSWSRRDVIGAGAAALTMGGLAARASAALPTATETGKVAVEGGTVVWRKFGGGPKTPLLMLHGGPGAPSDYLDTLGALGDERAVYTWDQLGCGRSDRPTDAALWTRERYVDEMGKVRAALGLDRVHLLGQSWGTMLAVDYLLERGQEGVRSVTLAGPCLSARRYNAGTDELVKTMTPKSQAAIDTAYRTGNSDTPEYLAAVDEYDRLFLSRKPSAETLPLLQRTMAGLGQGPYRTMNGPSEIRIVGTLKTYEREPDLKRLALPVLYLSGEFDECTPDAARAFAALTPKAHVAVITGAAHLTTIDDPEATNRTVRAFLTSVET